MRENRKFLFIIALMLLTFSVTILFIVVVNLRNFTIKEEMSRAESTAALVKDGLTTMMVTGSIAKREIFLNQIKDSSNALDVWIFRTDKVIHQFGKGFGSESIRDEIDKSVINQKKSKKYLNDSLESPTLRVTIPYIATSKGKIDCLKCHTEAKEGDVLGGISMVFDIRQIKYDSIYTILKIFAITLFAIIIFVYITDKFLKPYITTLAQIKLSLQRANEGDYSYRIKVSNHVDTSDAIRWLNTLFDKLENTIGAIEKNISLFVADRSQKFRDPLEKSQQIIEDLADIYKFKKTIEEDRDKSVVYKRLIKVFKEKLHIADLSLYEVDKNEDKRKLIYDDTPEKFCKKADKDTSINCRAFRTKSIVASDDFEGVCTSCKTVKEYLCVNFDIDDAISLTLNIKPETKDELRKNKRALGYIRNYLEAAKPILQSKILNEILHKSNQIDGLTKLYNRKYLDEFIEKINQKFDRYAVSMIDIDYFKKVNDSYGHDAGDMVLQGLSKIFKKCMKKEDVAFRFGGEEFLIFMPDVDSAFETISKIKDTFANTIFEVKDETVQKTLSAGIAHFPSDANTAWKVIKCADIALYEAKHSGRNRIIKCKNVKEEDKEG